MGDVKNFLYAWCGKRKITIAYEIRAVGNKNRQKFVCEVRVTGFNYIGMGNSTNKKDAQTNAARDFLNYLVRVNEIKSEEIPAFGAGAVGTSTEGTFGADAGDGLDAPLGGPDPPHLALKSETGK
uniref:DRBM domain-containing protein n=1 Tax=Micrurus spixii TaxID=129469 RepID=A0A2D4LBE9_9SAUR